VFKNREKIGGGGEGLNAKSNLGQKERANDQKIGKEVSPRKKTAFQLVWSG